MTDRHEFGIGEYTMRNGRKAVVHFIVREPNDCVYPICGEMELLDGKWTTAMWTAGGRLDRFSGEGTCDLLPPKRYVWVALYGQQVGSVNYSLENMIEYHYPHATHVLRAELNDDGTINWPTAVVLPIEEAKDDHWQ